MNSNKRTTRLGVLVAGSAAMLAFGMTAPAMAQQPADGTVGHVPAKVPPGQAADGVNDHNQGWQCDGNKGAGDGNPAHANTCVPTTVDGDPTSSSVVVDTNFS
ncbi:MAG: hypothetical protein QOK15_2744 [Nocardioidaceae bacterium]|jgi:hypothetical protein|nr:hypothetical protein [Nocardioidaceae bacterium]